MTGKPVWPTNTPETWEPTAPRGDLPTLTEAERDALAIACESVEVATDLHGDGATLTERVALRLADGLTPTVEAILATRHAAADQRLRDALAGFEALAEEWERTTGRARPAFLVAADELRAVIATALGVDGDPT